MNRFRFFFSRWQNWLGLLIVLFFVFVAIAAPLLSPLDSNQSEMTKVVGNPYKAVPAPPSSEAPLGTLPLGVSVYHALVWGTRSALLFGCIVVIISLIIGVLIGAISAYSGGFLNSFLMRVSDSFLSFPIIAGVVLISQIFSSVISNAVYMYAAAELGGANIPAFTDISSLVNLPLWLVVLQKIDPVMLTFILFSWMPYARITNIMVEQLNQTEYIQAAYSLGMKKSRIIFRHLLPNAIPPAIVLASKDVGVVVLLQAMFTFIGLVNDSPWGRLLVMGRNWIIGPGGISSYWWVFVPATLALILFGVGWNLLGDGINDMLNPRRGISYQND